MTFDGFDEIVDQIYEASVIPERWSSVLKRLAIIADCKDGMLVANPQHLHARWVASDGLVPMMTAFTQDGWGARNSKAAQLAPLRYPGFVTDLDIYSPGGVETDPFYLELMKPHGFWYSTGTMVHVPTGDLLVFDIERAYGEPPIEREAVARLDGLRPHLARASFLSARLGLECARNMVECLNAIGLPAAAFRQNGRVLATNASLEALDAQFVARAHDRLSVANPAANAQLAQALQRAAVDAWAGGSMSFPVPAIEEHPALIAHLVPVKRAAHDIFSGALSVLVVTPLAAPEAPSEDLLNGLFDLTPAEARVCRAIVEGKTIKVLAKTLGISYETVRGHLKLVLTKTGTARQAELVGLLANKIITKIR